MPRRTRAISFDLFDTLVDLHFERLPEVDVKGRRAPSTLGPQHALLVERGHALDLDTYVTALLESDRELAESHFAQGLEIPTLLRFERLAQRLRITEPGLAEALTRAHMDGIASVAETPAHHRGVLAALAERYRVGLCSNFSHAETALGILERDGLREHFHAVVISEKARFRKPRGEIFEVLLGELGVAPEEAVHVGDRLGDDVAGASAAGLRTVWLTRRVGDPERALREHDGAPPTWIVSDLAELPRVLAEAT